MGVIARPNQRGSWLEKIISFTSYLKPARSQYVFRIILGRSLHRHAIQSPLHNRISMLLRSTQITIFFLMSFLIYISIMIEITTNPLKNQSKLNMIIMNLWELKRGTRSTSQKLSITILSIITLTSQGSTSQISSVKRMLIGISWLCIL